VAKTKRVLMVVAREMFRDEEYDIPRRILESGGVEVTVASSIFGEAEGKYGLTAPVDLLIGDADIADYDGIIFVGGAGAQEYFDHPAAWGLAQESLAEGKTTAAICIAPHILAAAGVLDGRKATCFPSEAEAIESYGAEYTGVPVEIDGLVITANGPEAAEEFGNAVLDALGT
jgi:protease I